MKKLYVGNLSYKTNENDLRQAFERFGDVGQVSVITDRATGRSKGFAFVEMQNENEADDAINALNGAELDSRTLTVNEARPQEQRSNNGGGGRGGYNSNRRY
jgi:RNA-binding proteins (RRM domain)